MVYSCFNNSYRLVIIPDRFIDMGCLKLNVFKIMIIFNGFKRFKN